MRVGLVGDLREVRVVLLELGLRTQSQQLTLQTRIRSSLHRLRPTLRRAGSLIEGIAGAHHPAQGRGGCPGSYAGSWQLRKKRRIQGVLTAGILSECRCRKG